MIRKGHGRIAALFLATVMTAGFAADRSIGIVLAAEGERESDASVAESFSIERLTSNYTKVSAGYTASDYRGEAKVFPMEEAVAASDNWNNFLVILQNVPEVHSAEGNADYKEYAVLRADNWGWGAGYENIAVAECDWNWDTFTTDMDGASVELTITNNGDTADVVAVVTTAAGTVYNQKYTGIAVDGDLYYCLSVDAAFLDIQ